MLIKKDINTLSAPNFSPINFNIDSNKSHSNQKRRPILKKKTLCQNIDEVQNQSDKQNPPCYSRPKISQSDNLTDKQSFDCMRKVQNKKKSIFLELDELQNSSKKRNCDNTKKISFVSLANNEEVDVQIRKSNLNYKQSKIQILFSNSNISDTFWNNPTHKQIDFDLPQKSSTTLKSLKVVQLQPNEPTSIKLQFKKAHHYQVKKSDRIIQDSDRKGPNKHYKIPAKQNKNQQKQNQLSTASSNFFKKTAHYAIDYISNDGQGNNFTIKKTPPPAEKQLGSCQQQRKLKLKDIKTQGSKMNVRKTKQANLHKKQNPEQRNKGRQNLQESGSKQAQDLLVTLNPVSSQVLPQLTPPGKVQCQGSFEQDFFEMINSYRFLNRLCYKVGKYMVFYENKQSCEELVAQMTKLKCFTLLNAELELQTLHSFQNKSLNGAHQFLTIIQQYIDKEKIFSHWRHAQSQFLKVTDSPFSLKSKIITFFEQTLPLFQQQLREVLPNLEKDLRSKGSLLIQLKFKILKHLLYDVMKMNFFQQRQFPVSLQAIESRKERLVSLIEKDEWFSKIPFHQIPPQFQQLKKDFQYLRF